MAGERLPAESTPSSAPVTEEPVTAKRQRDSAAVGIPNEGDAAATVCMREAGGHPGDWPFSPVGGVETTPTDPIVSSRLATTDASDTTDPISGTSMDTYGGGAARAQRSARSSPSCVKLGASWRATARLQLRAKLRAPESKTALKRSLPGAPRAT